MGDGMLSSASQIEILPFDFFFFFLVRFRQAVTGVFARRICLGSAVVSSGVYGIMTGFNK